MAGSLDSRVAIITGSGRGIGRAVAEKFVAEGATVVVSDIDGASADAVAEEIGNGAWAKQADAADEPQVEALVGAAVERHGGIQLVVANAGIGTVSPLTQMSFAQWRELMSINLDGVFLMTKHGGGALAAAGGGSLVNVASITALGGFPIIGHYAAAKAAVVSLSQTAALELRPAGVRVNAICPGFIDTDMVGDRKDELEAALGIDFAEIIATKQGRLGTPEEVAHLAVFLASDRSSFSSGGHHVIDGGWTASLI